MTESRTIPIEPFYGLASWTVGFVDLEDGPEVLNAPRLTGLAAYRDAKERCLRRVRKLAGPGWPVRVHRIKLERRELFGRRRPVIVMSVTTITDYLPVKIRSRA